MEYGWICPRCNIVNAPHMDMCKNCLPTKEEQEAVINKATASKTHVWKKSDTELKSMSAEVNWTNSAFILPGTDGRTLHWDDKHFIVENKYGSTCYDVAWDRIDSWWIAPPLDDKDYTVVVKGAVSGFLYSLDLGNTFIAHELVENVFRHHVKEKEISV